MNCILYQECWFTDSLVRGIVVGRCGGNASALFSVSSLLHIQRERSINNVNQPIPFRPRFGGPIEGHAVNTIKRWYPRLADQMEFEDLLQEAWVVFLRCQARYGGTVDNPRWFMALFSVSLHRRFCSLLSDNPAYISDEDLNEQYEPTTELDVGYYWRVLQELPADMRELLAALGLGDDTVLPALRRRLRELGEVTAAVFSTTTEGG